MLHDFEHLEKQANVARLGLLEIIFKSKAAHLGSSLSCIEILLACMEIKDVDDSLVISKGHAAAGLYACLNARGIMPDEVLRSYGADGSKLFGHVSKESGYGIEFSTGSLGHGLPYGVGLALGSKRANQVKNVFVVMSDGELNEGTTWESALLASHHKLDNVFAIVDRNGIQSMQGTEDTLALEPLSAKWRAFGWNTAEVDGHSFQQVINSLRQERTGKPNAIIANTVKGKGVSFMEGDNRWHYAPPSHKELELARRELGG